MWSFAGLQAERCSGQGRQGLEGVILLDVNMLVIRDTGLPGHV